MDLGDLSGRKLAICRIFFALNGTGTSSDVASVKRASRNVAKGELEYVIVGKGRPECVSPFA